MRFKRGLAVLFVLAICAISSLGNRAMADSLPDFTINATDYLPGEEMEVSVSHVEELSGRKYLEIIWLDTGNVVYRTELGQTKFTLSAPPNAGSYKIRLILENDKQEKKFTVTADGENAGRLCGRTDKNDAGDILDVFLYWSEVEGQAYYIERIAADGTSASYGPIYLAGWTDVHIEPNTTYTYTVSDRTRVFNSVIIDTTGFIPSEYSKNSNTGIIELQVGNPYMTISIPGKEDNSILIDPENINIVPILQQGRVMLPIRAVVEAMEGTVMWQGDNQSVIIEAWKRTVEIPVGSETIFVNGEPRSFDVPAEVVDGRTRVPIRHLESLGCEVEWRNEIRGVCIKFHVDAD